MAVEKNGVITAKLLLRIVVIHHPFDTKFVGESAKVRIPKGVLYWHFDFFTCRPSVSNVHDFFCSSADRFSQLGTSLKR
jgi:hypothetical protein